MPGIDDLRANLLHEVMSRPFRFFLPVACTTLSLGFTACVGTVYDRMYSNEKSHFKPPAEKKDVSAQDILGALDNKKAPGGLPVDSGNALPPPAAPEIPGLPAAPGDAPAPAPGAAPMVPPAPAN
jgi:hypothetical protein